MTEQLNHIDDLKEHEHIKNHVEIGYKKSSIAAYIKDSNDFKGANSVFGLNLFFSFHYYKFLNVSDQLKLHELLENINLKRLNYKLNSQLKIDDEKDNVEVKKLINVYSYILNHSSNNNTIKFVLLSIAGQVSFLDNEVIDEILAHGEIYEKRIAKSPYYSLASDFSTIIGGLVDFEGNSPGKFIKNHKLANWLYDLDASKHFNEFSSKSFVSKANSLISRFDYDAVNADLYMDTYRFMHYYDNEPDPKSKKFDYELRLVEAVRKSLKGFENVSSAEFAAFLASTKFGLIITSLVANEKLSHPLPILKDFVNVWKVDKSLFNKDKFIECFERNFVNDFDANKARLFFNHYHKLAFVYMFLNSNDDLFSDFSQYVLKKKLNVSKVCSTEMLALLKDWKENNSHIPFSLFANLNETERKKG